MLKVKKQPAPLDYSKCNQTVTLYHHSPGTKEISRVVIEHGAYLVPRRQSHLNNIGSSESNSFLLVIPQSSCRYLPPDAFTGAEGTYTLASQDKAQLGEGPVLATVAEWAAHIPAKVDGLVVIKNVAPQYWQGEICHVEAGG